MGLKGFDVRINLGRHAGSSNTVKIDKKRNDTTWFVPEQAAA